MKLTHGAALALTGRYLLQPPRFKPSGQKSSGREPISGTLGQFQRQPEQFQRDFDEVFDRCLQARWRSAMRPRALPVESHIEDGQVVIRADLP
jgi:hypothetical protein